MINQFGLPAALLTIVVAVSLICHFQIRSISKACRIAAPCSTIVAIFLTEVWYGFTSLQQLVVFAVGIYYVSYIGAYVVSRFPLRYAWNSKELQTERILPSSFNVYDQKECTTPEHMNVEQMICEYRDLPIGKSIVQLAKALKAQSVFVGTADVTPTQEGKITGKIEFKVGADKHGCMWIYAYTKREEFSKAFPEGGPFIEISFLDLFEMVEKDQQFAGIFLNSCSDSSLPIPKEIFGLIRRALSSDWN